VSMQFVVGFLGGLVWANWIEYFWHRWGMHWPSICPSAAIRHSSHHRNPNDPEFISTGVLVGSILFLVNTALWAIPLSLTHHLHVLLGLMVSFILYLAGEEHFHYRVHMGGWVPMWWREHHLKHHSRPRSDFNIFFPFWDYLLRTKSS